MKNTILNFILSHKGAISRGQLCDALRLADSSVARCLSELEHAGLIEKSGGGRSTVYFADAADSYLHSHASLQRKPIHYDFNRFRAYSQLSSFFTDTQKQILQQAGKIPESFTHDDYLSSIHRKMLLETSWASSVLEGNTYSLIDTQELFERGIEMKGARFEETQMLLNHKHAIEYVLEHSMAIHLSRREVLNIHALLSDGLMKDPRDVGRIRQRAVAIGQSAYLPLDVPTQLSEELDVLLSIAKDINDPFDQSFFLMCNLAYLQSFNDVNKRTARLMSNLPLLKGGLMPMSFYQMSRVGYEHGMLHYYETGDSRRLAKEYVKCYQISAQRFAEIMANKPTEHELRLRLKLRKEIARCVFEVVKHGCRIEDLVGETLPIDERNYLVEYAGKVIEGLNEGNVILYGLTPNDLPDANGTLLMAPHK